MRRIGAAVTGAILATALGACAAVAGIDQYHKAEGCFDGCDGPSLDAGLPDSQEAVDAQVPSDAQETGDDAMNRGTPDTGSGAADSGGPPDSGVPSDGGGGCGSLESVDNCGMCGVECDKTTGTPSCTGATCTYQCITGHTDCDMTVPNTNGCECATPGCCGTGCETAHSDGVGQSFFDCNAKATYSETTGFSACTAYALSVGATAADCFGPLYCSGNSAPTICFGTGGSQCTSYCWEYAGKYADGGAGTVWDCTCPAHAVGSWN